MKGLGLGLMLKICKFFHVLSSKPTVKKENQKKTQDPR